MFNKILYIFLIVAIYVGTNQLTPYEKLLIPSSINSTSVSFDDITQTYDWAQEAITTFAKLGIITGDGQNKFNPSEFITNEEIAKLLVLAFRIKSDIPSTNTFADVNDSLWSYTYIETARDLFLKTTSNDGSKYFYPQSPVKRQEAIYSLINACGYKDTDLKDIKTLNRYHDYADISPEYRVAMAIAVEKGIIAGDNNMLRPLDRLTRAEMAVLLLRATKSSAKQTINEPVLKSETSTVYTPYTATADTCTPIEGKTLTNANQMKTWAKSRGAHQRFIDAADLYLKYASLTGLRAEVLYCQAAKETNFGHYTGNVLPSQNNWAGIKILNPTGDKAEDHETFATADDGIRAHFNHMCAYTGTDTVGELHQRYMVVSSLDWSGNIKYVEELGCRWAPDSQYGISIINNYMNELLQT